MKRKNLHEDLSILLKKANRQTSFSIGEILNIFPGKGRELLLIFLSFPFCLPIQIPGLSTPFGLIIAFIGFRMAYAKRIWLPKKVMLQTISSSTVQRIAQKCLGFMKKMAPWIHPRLGWLSKHRIMHISNGLLFVLLGLFLALPLPIPLTNFLAGWAIFLLSIGLLEDDGVFILAGYLIALFIILLFYTVSRKVL